MVPGCEETVFRNFCLNQLHVKRKKIGKKKKKDRVTALEKKKKKKCYSFGELIRDSSDLEVRLVLVGSQ